MSANKLKKVCIEVIGHEQLAYVNGGVLQDGHLLVGRVLEMARQHCHQAVWDSLHHMNVGPDLIAHLKTL
jgi:hypothetical protein